MKGNYYEVLGIRKDATASEIKSAYRKLAKKYHPDSNKGNADAAAKKFAEVNEAYNVLSDEKKRKMYDRYGSAAFDGNGNFTGQPGGGFGDGFYQSSGPGGGFHEYHFESGGDMDDILKNIFGGFGGFSGSGSSGSSRQSYSGFTGNSSYGQNYGGYTGNGYRQSRAEKGSDIESSLTVSFMEAVSGGKRRIRLQSESGQNQSLEVNIPAGIADGKTIRLKGKGRAGRNGGPAGDLLLKIHVEESPEFRREGQDLYTTVYVPFSTAVSGGEAKIHTIHGDVICKIREGTQSGSKIRLKNKGVPVMGNPSVHGDQYVTVEVKVPKNLSYEAKEKLKEFEDLCRRTGSRV